MARSKSWMLVSIDSTVAPLTCHSLIVPQVIFTDQVFLTGYGSTHLTQHSNLFCVSYYPRMAKQISQLTPLNYRNYSRFSLSSSGLIVIVESEMSTGCTAMVLVSRPVLHETQVEENTKKPAAPVGPGARGLTLGRDRDAGNHRNYAKMESSKLDVYIRDRVPEVLWLHNVFQGRVWELVQALLEMKSRFDSQGARNDLHDIKVTGWHDYLRLIGVNPSTFRSWKHRTEAKQLVDMVDPQPTAPTRSRNGSGRTGKPRSNPVQSTGAKEAARNLAQAKKEFGKSAAEGNAQAIAIIAGYEREYAAACDPGDEGPTEPVTAARRTIAPALTRREVPEPATTGDKHAAMYHAAFAAAVAAANAVQEETIKPRFYPVLIFLTDRTSVTFGRYLETQGIRKGGPHGEKWRGRTCFKLPGGKPYRTYEEAWAYVEAFAKALPDLDICYGVDFTCAGETQGGRPYERRVVIDRRNEPEPSHGG